MRIYGSLSLIKLSLVYIGNAYLKGVSLKMRRIFGAIGPKLVNFGESYINNTKK